MSKAIYDLYYSDDVAKGHVTVEASTYKEACDIARERLPRPGTRHNKTMSNIRFKPEWSFEMISCIDTEIRKVIPDQTNIDASTSIVASKVKF